jgi:Zn-dependent M28 family amino/carboxypeptidase
VFLGANDGASGVALLHELGKHMAALKGKYGVDFMFFDGEEFVFEYRRDPMFLGSTYFANQYAAGKWPANYTYAVLVDMVGDKNLEIWYEGNSMTYAPRLTRSIWSVASRLGVKAFIPKERHKIRDDHLPLNSIARIRTCDIIDFDYPTVESKNAFWHTEQDVPENCSADSLTQVGWVLLEWLKEMEKLN